MPSREGSMRSRRKSATWGAQWSRFGRKLRTRWAKWKNSCVVPKKIRKKVESKEDLPMIRMRPGHISVIILMLGSFVALMGCVATGVQPIDLSYVPAAPPEKADAEISKLTFGVAQFIDARSQKEFVAEIPWPAGKAQYKASKPLGAIVAEAVGKRLEAAGLKVVQLGEIWNLELGSLKENWPDVVIGGRIDQFWATTNTDDTIHKVDADVSLHMVVATPRGKRAL